MAFTLTVESFLICLKESGLVDADLTASLLMELTDRGIDLEDPRAIADGLVQNGVLTRWQADHLLKGKRRGFVLGKYRLLSLLGRGGQHAVYLAEHTLMRRRCAIKVLPAKNLSDPSVLTRFHQEARAIALLDHTNIVRAFDVDKGLDGKVEIHFFVMELVDGESLHERVVRDGPLEPVEAANFIRQAAVGLAHAHRAGIVHRDVKPANLLVDRAGVVKILDLGMARFFDDNSSSAPEGYQRIRGTVDFISPEQALDSSSADERSDIYSLGCTFYFLLAGRPPFAEGNLAERLVAHQSQEPVSIAERRPGVSADLADIVHRMLAKNPAHRIASADQVAEILRQWLVEHASPQWLRLHPGVVGPGTATRRTSASVTEPAIAVTAPSAPIVQAGGRTSSNRPAPIVEARPSALDMFEVELSRIPPAEKPPPPPDAGVLERIWSDRKMREIVIAAGGIFLAVCLAGGLQLIVWIINSN